MNKKITDNIFNSTDFDVANIDRSDRKAGGFIFLNCGFIVKMRKLTIE